MASAAYRAGERLRDERTGLLHDYSDRREEARISSWIQAPHDAPAWAWDRSELWNRVEAVETRKNSRPAREAELALPVELSQEQQDRLIWSYSQEQYVERGMVADVCVHRGNPENPHVHIMVTTRELVGGDGFARSKARDWDGPQVVKEMRRSWELHQNRELERAGRPERVDSRSHRDRGIDREPTTHEGPQVRAMEERGIYTERGAYNRGVMYRNEERDQRLAEGERKVQREDERRREEEAREQPRREEEAQRDREEEERVAERRRRREERERAEREREHERER